MRAFALAALLVTLATSARAQEPVPQSSAPPEPPPPPQAAAATRPPEEGLLPRFGVFPTVGTGIAKVSNAAPFPGFIGLTTLGGEVHLEVPPYGGLFRFQFHSSGDTGRWTAPSFALGGSYRLFGDALEHWALLARGGLLWERWHAISENSNCPIDFFVPTNCKALQPKAPSGVILNNPAVIEQASDLYGVFAGLRAEAPTRYFYLAGDFELDGLVNLGGTFPSTVLAARIAVVVGFRDLRASERAPAPTPRDRKRY
jgi:hypothetical protein